MRQLSLPILFPDLHRPYDFPYAPTDTVNLAASGVVGNYCVPEHYDRKVRIGKKEKEFFIDFCRLSSDISDAFTAHFIEPDKEPDYYRDTLERKLKSVARFIGIPLEVSFPESFTLSEKFDYQFFIAFALLMFSLCRRKGQKRLAKVEISRFRSDCCVCIEFLTEEANLSGSPESESIKNIADRLNLVYDARQADGIFRFRLCPIREDWSLLGLKSPPVFRWDK